MKTLFGRIHLGRLPNEIERHNQLLRELKKIRMKTEEAVELLNAANAKLNTANTALTDTKALVIKVGGETDKLKEQIANLPLPGDASPELVAAIAAISTTIDNTAALANQAKEAAGVVDAKVEDAPDPTPEQPA